MNGIARREDTIIIIKKIVITMIIIITIAIIMVLPVPRLPRAPFRI